jgi:hypothetical protein
MSIENVKNSLALPEAGQIRKGAAKTEKGPGRDLGAKFRVVFFDGEENQKSKARFLEVHKGQCTLDEHGGIILDPADLVIMFPFSNPSQCWDPFYEAYTAGRMVARADGVRFIRWIDTKTGNLIVANGEKFLPFTPGMSVGAYTNNRGQEVEIKAKATGRLRMVLPELVRFATMTVHTTSIYDVVRLTQQIDGLQYIASLLPRNTGVAGIPLTLTRRWTTVTWSKPDGSAQRVKSALLNIEADPDWVVKMFKRMGDLALPTGVQALLPTSQEVQMDISPHDLDQAQSEADGYNDDEGGEEGQTDQASSTPVAAASSQPLVINSTIKDPVGPSSNDNGSNHQDPQPEARPYPAEKVVQTIAKIAAVYQEQINQGNRQQKLDKDNGGVMVYVTQLDRNMVAANLNMCFIGKTNTDKIRHSVLAYLCNHDSVNDLSECQVLALSSWLKATKDSGGEWKPDRLSVIEAQGVYTAALKAAGQLELALDPAAEEDIPVDFR